MGRDLLFMVPKHIAQLMVAIAEQGAEGSTEDVVVRTQDALPAFLGVIGRTLSTWGAFLT